MTVLVTTDRKSTFPYIYVIQFVSAHNKLNTETTMLKMLANILSYFSKKEAFTVKIII